MALIGLGAFIGDSFVRITIGFIQKNYTNSWRFIILFCSIITISISIPMLSLLSDSPKSKNLPLLKENDKTNVYNKNNENNDKLKEKII